MNTLMILLTLSLAVTGARADFICPDGSNEACLGAGDSVCPVYAKCVDDNAICFDPASCESATGFICGSKYDAVMKDHEKVVGQYNQLISENVDLREMRLEQKNCVINAHTLKDAIRCVR